MYVGKLVRWRHWGLRDLNATCQCYVHVRKLGVVQGILVYDSSVAPRKAAFPRQRIVLCNRRILHSSLTHFLRRILSYVR